MSRANAHRERPALPAPERQRARAGHECDRASSDRERSCVAFCDAHDGHRGILDPGGRERTPDAFPLLSLSDSSGFRGFFGTFAENDAGVLAPRRAVRLDPGLRGPTALAR